MNVVLLGTGSPVPLLQRAGTSIAFSSGDEWLLFDCGPGTVRRLLEQGINPGRIDHLFFTHHHIDHNADFYNFVINNWIRGDGALQIHGPNPWTESLLASLYDIYEEDIQYRDHVGYSAEAIQHLEVDPITEDSIVDTDRFQVRACRVNHSIETYAYRITDGTTDRSAVFSGDTRKIDQLVDFAAGVELLIQDCCIAPSSETAPNPGGEHVWEQYTRPLPTEMHDKLQEVHCNPTEAGEIAAEAGVEQLVLTHLLPYRDEAAIVDMAAAVYDGQITVASDGLSLPL